MAEKQGRNAVDKHVEKAAQRIYSVLTDTFPVCSASDEFHYFPQAVQKDRRWSNWDNFSAQAVGLVAGELSRTEHELESLRAEVSGRQSLVDINTLQRICRTLREQLTEARFQETQPTLYLSILGIGLADALESKDPAAWPRRTASLPAFINNSIDSLRNMPGIYRDLGLEMLADLRAWLTKLSDTRPGLEPSIEALDRFERRLKKCSVEKDFRVPRDLMERIVKYHIGCSGGINEIKAEIESEINEMEELMEREAHRLVPGQTWREVMRDIPLPELPADGLIGLYRAEVERLGRHCVEHSLVSEAMHNHNPVRVEPVPPYLAAVRSAAAYSMAPGHPPRGGVFYLIDMGVPERMFRTLHRDCRMLSAHETWPGHHLLDTWRWSLENEVRRPLELPLFYEGWACFAEDLMMQTGYFHKPTDRIQLARRHYWRAVRGRIDLGLHTGELDVAEAADRLAGAGMDRARALQAVRRYALKPGYQLCYTIGIRRFRALYYKYGGGDPAGFARSVLSQGETGFEDLEEYMKDQGKIGS